MWVVKLVREMRDFSLNAVPGLEPLQNRVMRFDVNIKLGSRELQGKKVGHVDVVLVFIQPVLFPASQKACDYPLAVDDAYLARNIRTCGIERRDGSRALPSKHFE